MKIRYGGWIGRKEEYRSGYVESFSGTVAESKREQEELLRRIEFDAATGVQTKSRRRTTKSGRYTTQAKLSAGDGEVEG